VISIPNLDKMTPAQRQEVATKLKTEAAELEARAELLQKEITDKSTERESCNDRAYHLRRMAYSVENYAPDPKS
jgi:hypothetical protein